MDPNYAAAYRELYDRHWWWRARERFLIRRLEAEAAGSDAKATRRILDVGCGDALFFDRLAEFGRVEGVEPDESILSEGPWRSSIHAGTLETFSTNTPFDWILMLDVLEHMPEPSRALRRARALAADGAKLFVTVPAFQLFWSRHDEVNRHHTRYDRATLTSLLTESGWMPLEAVYFFHWLAPLKLLTKAGEQLFPGRSRIESVPPAPVNRLALGLSLLEQDLLGWLPVPFGTSLYAESVAAES